MTAYADYAFYTTTFLGTQIASADFAALALKASQYVDQMTYNRVAAVILAGTDTANIALIKMAVCNVAEQLQTINMSGSSGGGGIKSESIGNNSVTYMDGTFATLSTTAKLRQAASLYLGSTGYMYAGFASGEYGGVLDED